MKEDILRKIKSCLSLSKSSNEHEASIALRMAHSMMRKHDFSQEDILLSDIKNKISQAKTTLKKEWIHHLIALIETSFTVLAVVNTKSKEIKFYGRDMNAQLASYAFDSLYKQVLFARKDYLETKLRRFKRANKTLRADQFALGWIAKITEELERFIDSYDRASQKEIREIVTNHFSLVDLEPMNQRDLKDNRAYEEGFKKGESGYLHNPLSNSSSNLLN